MSESCIIIIHTPKNNVHNENWKRSLASPDRPVMLYSRRDGKPDDMLNKVRLYMDAACDYLNENGQEDQWSAELASALFILFSADTVRLAEFLHVIRREPDNRELLANNNPDKGLPGLLPCSRQPNDVAYVYDIFLTPKASSFSMKWRKILNLNNVIAKKPQDNTGCKVSPTVHPRNLNPVP